MAKKKIDKKRAAFEAWLLSHPEWSNTKNPVANYTFENGEYFYNHVKLAYEAYCHALSLFRTEAYVVHHAMAERELSWHKEGISPVRLYKKKE